MHELLGDYDSRYPNHFDKRRNMKKLYYHNRGLHWALGIEGNKNEIETQYNSLFNHGAIEKTADLQWMGDNLAYVWTTQERLKKYFKKFLSLTALFKSFCSNSILKIFLIIV